MLTIVYGRRALFNLLQGTDMPATIRGTHFNHFFFNNDVHWSLNYLAWEKLNKPLRLRYLSHLPVSDPNVGWVAKKSQVNTEHFYIFACCNRALVLWPSIWLIFSKVNYGLEKIHIAVMIDMFITISYPSQLPSYEVWDILAMVYNKFINLWYRQTQVLNWKVNTFWCIWTNYHCCHFSGEDNF